MALGRVPIIDFDDQAIEFLPVSHRTPRFEAWMQGMLDGSIKWINNNFWNYCYGDNTSPVWSISVTYNLNQKSITYNGVYISVLDGNKGNNPDFTPIYDPSISYVVGFSVLYLGIYYIANTATTGTFNTSDWTLLSGSVWYKISDSNIGAQERILYTSQKLNMEWGLNQYFRTTFRFPSAIISGGYSPRPDIFIDTIPVTARSFLRYPTEVGSSHRYPLRGDGTYRYPTAIYSTFSSYKFQVNIPAILAFNLGVNYESIIRSKVDLVNPAGISYIVVVY